MYLEGYEDEGLVEVSADDPTVVSQEVHQSGGTTIIDRKHQTTFSAVPGEFSAFGIQETTI